MLNLTKNETAILTEVHNFMYVDGNDLADLPIWTSSFVDDAAAVAGLTKSQVKGVISSLVQKGYLATDNTCKKEDHTIIVTRLGADTNELLNAPGDFKDGRTAEKDFSKMTRKECLAALKAAGYTGPTSYLMPKLREIVRSLA